MSRRQGRPASSVHARVQRTALPIQERPGPMESGIDTVVRAAPPARDAAAQPPLRIGLMLRAVDDVDGQGIYIRELCDALFDLDTRNEYVAFYSNESQAGRYTQRPNVREMVVPGRGKLLWDQWSVPRAAR